VVEEEEYNSVFSALSHPLRRNILSFIVERGPQGYSELLTQFSLETGTLNYHLERMTAFLSQDDNGKYKATNVGYAANKLLAVAKTELSNPHAPPVRGLGISTRLHLFGQAIFDVFLLPEQAFEEAQNLAWPYVLIGGLVILGYLSIHYLIGRFNYLIYGIVTVVLLTGFFILSGFGIYRHRFSLLSALSCYGFGFLPLTVWNVLSLVTDATYSQLISFLLFLLLVWDAYLFLLAGRESFKLTMSQSFTSTALGFVLFIVVIRVIDAFGSVTIRIP
jgi:DNA-binding transcriptional ArsR family regulator